MEQIIIGVDPHKLSATVEVVDDLERFLGSGRFSTVQAGYTSMLRYAKAWPERIWAVEGANGAVDHWPSGSSRPARAFSMYRPSCCPGPALRHRAQPKDRRA